VKNEKCHQRNETFTMILGIDGVSFKFVKCDMLFIVFKYTQWLKWTSSPLDEMSNGVNFHGEISG